MGSLAGTLAGIFLVGGCGEAPPPERGAFRARYREPFDPRVRPAAPAGPDVPSCDAAAVALAALREGARTGGEVRECLMSLERIRPPHPGVAGPVAFHEAGNGDRSFVLRRIRGGGTP